MRFPFSHSLIILQENESRGLHIMDNRQRKFTLETWKKDQFDLWHNYSVLPQN